MAPVVAGAGLALSVFGQVQRGRAEKKAAEANARAATEEAAVREAQQREEDQRTMAYARAAYGASGVDLGSGSPLDQLAESARQAELNAQRIRRGGQLEADSQRRAGRQAERSGYIQGGSSLLTGIGELL